MICLFEFSNIKVRNIFKVNNKNTRRRSDVFIAESHVILVGFFFAKFEQVNGRWNTLLP